MPEQPQKIVEQLRQAVADAEGAGMSRYRIAQIAGIDRAQLSRLLDRSVAPRLDTAEKIAAACGYQVNLKKLRRKR